MSQSTVSQDKPQIYHLTFIRFIAAMVIVFHHFAVEREQPIFPFNKSVVLFEVFKGGFIGVSFFYVLSGFIMVYAYGSRPGKLNKKEFWIMRFARIYPMHLLTFLVLFFLPAYVSTWLNAPSVTFQLTLTQAWSYAYRHSYNWPAWSLSVEMFFYMIFPFLLGYFKKMSLKNMLIFIGIFWVVSMLRQVFFPIIKFPLPLLHVNSFLVGMGSGFIYNLRRPFISAQLLKILIPSLIVIICVMATQYEIAVLNTGLLSPLFAAFILFFAWSKGFFSRLFSNPFFVLMGDISYSIYIIHWSFWVIYVRKVHLFTNSMIQFYAYVGALLLLAYISYEFIENPIRLWVKKTIKKTN